jgi:hypothetical protein
VSGRPGPVTGAVAKFRAEVLLQAHLPALDQMNCSKRPFGLPDGVAGDGPAAADQVERFLGIHPGR